MRTIDFFIVGAMKSGTTSLRDTLRRHPGVYLPSGEGRLFHRQMTEEMISKYQAKYSEAPPQAKCGDKSPQYGPSPLAAERIRAHNREARIIWILRDPMKRAVSQHRHASAKQMLPLDHFGKQLDAFEKKEEPYWQNPVFRSRYDLQIPEYDERFDSVLVCLLEDLIREPQRELSRVQSFIGVPVMDLGLDHVHRTSDAVRSQVSITSCQRDRLKGLLMPSVDFVERRLGRTLHEWRLSFA